MKDDVKSRRRENVPPQIRFHVRRLEIPSFFDGLSCTPYLSVSTPVPSAASLPYPISDVLSA